MNRRSSELQRPPDPAIIDLARALARAHARRDHAAWLAAAKQDATDGNHRP